nr:response regulator transcription factor [Maliibacterium massiliense]
MSHILICDDQHVLHETLGAYLAAEGFTYASAYDGDSALRKALGEHPDLIVLDLMMPGRSGLDVCREIRRSSKVPIIMLTAKGEEFDRVLGLEMGADDYIVKPFSPREVAARIRAVLRRTGSVDATVTTAQPVLHYPGLDIDINAYEVTLNGQRIACTPKEVEVLYTLAAHPGQVFGREQLLNALWGYDYSGDARAVDTQIKRIRQKLPQQETPWCIRTIYGVGYKFEVAP